MGRVTSNGVAHEVTRVTLVIRLLSLLLVAVGFRGLSVAPVVGYVLIGVVTVWLLRSARAREFMTMHPLALMVDTMFMAIVTVLSGGESPFVLTFLTSALLIGMWTGPWAGSLIIGTLIVLYRLVWQPSEAPTTLGWLAIPFIVLLLWWLGYAIQQAGIAEARSRQALGRAITVAAAHEERARLARDMHDTLAKSLQAMHLTATALPVLIDRDTESSKEFAQDLQTMSVQAIHDARALMSQLRREPEGDCLAEMAEQLCDEWEATAEVRLARHIDPEAIVSDELVRYELLMGLGEALENIRRHARANEVTVTLRAAGDNVEIDVADDGVGIPEGRLDEAYAAGHYGFRGMGERMDKVGGSLTVESVPGGGTRVVLSAPRHGLVEVVGGLT